MAARALINRPGEAAAGMTHCQLARRGQAVRQRPQPQMRTLEDVEDGRSDTRFLRAVALRVALAQRAKVRSMSASPSPRRTCEGL